MTIRTRGMTIRLAAAAGAVLAVALGASQAHAHGPLSPAQATHLQHQVDNVLRYAAPGARQVNPTTVVWPRDGVVLTLPVPGQATLARGLPNCRRGYACVWRDAGYAGPRAAFFRYGTYDLRRYGFRAFTHSGVSSYYNHQWGGAKLFLNTVEGTFRLRNHANLTTLNDQGISVTLSP
jgi:hypothetical protein